MILIILNLQINCKNYKISIINIKVIYKILNKFKFIFYIFNLNYPVIIIYILKLKHSKKYFKCLIMFANNRNLTKIKYASS